jgi:putative membrane protein
MFLYAKSLCIGAVEVLHGVSGGSMALILGIYHELVFSISEIDRKALAYLRKYQWKLCWKKINGNFLLTVTTGIIMGWFSLLWLIGYLHRYFFIPVNAFFFGLIFISTLLILRKIKVWNLRIVLAFFAGVALSYTFTVLTPLSLPDNLFTAMLAGIISVCSLFIPGVSGAFILLLLGKYQYIVASFIELNAAVIAFFFTGCIIGLAVLSRIIRWMLAHYQSVTVALLAGLTIGALNKLWPWRNVIEYASNGMGDRIPASDKSVLPWDYVTVTGKDPQVLQAILMVALGVFIVVIIEKVVARLKIKI